MITGIHGFLGKHIAEQLKSDNKIIGINQQNKKNSSQSLDYETIEGDISDKNTLSKINTDIDYIFHFGSPTSIVLFKKDPIGYFNNTINGMQNILEFAKNKSIKKLIYPSSASVYANNSQPHIENIIPKPANKYGEAKVECENIAKKYVESVDSLGLRIFAAYGPGEERKQNLSSVINLFLDDVRKNETPIIFGDGTQTRDFIYIDDVIDGILNAADLPNQGIINVGSGVSTSFNQIIQKISILTGKEFTPKYVKKETTYIENLKADTNLMKTLLKINPISVDKGIEKFIKYLGIIK